MKRPQRRNLALHAVALGLAAACAGCSGTSSSDEGTIPIGVMLDLTGPLASQGRAQKNAVDLVLKDIEAKGGIKGRRIEPIFVNSESSPDRAAALARQLARDDVIAIVGPSFAGTCAPVQPLIEREKIFTYCLSGAPFEWTPHFFAALPAPAPSLGDIPAEWARREGHRSIACLATSDRSGDGYSEALKNATERRGQRFDLIKFASGDSSVETQLTKIRGNDPDLIYSCSSGGNLVTVAKGMIALNMKQPLFAGLGSVSRPIAELSKGTLPSGGIYALGSWIDVPESIPADHPNRKGIRDFVTKYERAYGQSPDVLSASAADGLSLVVAALENGANTGTEIAKHVETLPKFEGVGATFSSFRTNNHRGATPDGIIIQFTASGDFKFVTKVDV